MGALFRPPFNNAWGRWKGTANWDSPVRPAHKPGQPYCYDINFEGTPTEAKILGKVYAARAGVVIGVRNNVLHSDWKEAGGTYPSGVLEVLEDLQSDLLAALAGAEIGHDTGPGNYVLIRHSDNTVFTYAHLQYDSIPVHPGDYVFQGTYLGIVGDTGHASRVHLHFGNY